MMVKPIIPRKQVKEELGGKQQEIDPYLKLFIKHLIFSLKNSKLNLV